MKTRAYKSTSAFLLTDFVKTSAALWLAAVALGGGRLFGASSNCTSGGRSECGGCSATATATVIGTTALDSATAAALKVSPKYAPLPPGAVRPTGWLLDWAKAARDEPRDPGLRGSYRFTEIGHPTPCCMGRCNRILPFYIAHMWMATMDRGLAATLFGPCQVEAKVAHSASLSIQCQRHIRLKKR